MHGTELSPNLCIVGQTIRCSGQLLNAPVKSQTDHVACIVCGPLIDES